MPISWSKNAEGKWVCGTCGAAVKRRSEHHKRFSGRNGHPKYTPDPKKVANARRNLLGGKKKSGGSKKKVRKTVTKKKGGTTTKAKPTKTSSTSRKTSNTLNTKVRRQSLKVGTVSAGSKKTGSTSKSERGRVGGIKAKLPLRSKNKTEVSIDYKEMIANMQPRAGRTGRKKHSNYKLSKLYGKTPAKAIIFNNVVIDENRLRTLLRHEIHAISSEQQADSLLEIEKKIAELEKQKILLDNSPQGEING